MPLFTNFDEIFFYMELDYFLKEENNKLESLKDNNLVKKMSKIDRNNSGRL